MDSGIIPIWSSPTGMKQKSYQAYLVYLITTAITMRDGSKM